MPKSVSRAVLCHISVHGGCEASGCQFTPPGPYVSQWIVRSRRALKIETGECAYECSADGPQACPASTPFRGPKGDQLQNLFRGRPYPLLQYPLLQYALRERLA